MKKLVELRSKLQAEQAALSAQLTAIRTDRASAVHTAPFDEEGAILAVARAKTQDLLEGTDSATALKAELHTQREAIAAQLGAEERGQADSLRAERHLLADREMLAVQIRQISQDIEAGLQSAARESAAKELKNYASALAKLQQSLIRYAGAAKVTGNAALPNLLEYTLPFPLGENLPESVARYFHRVGYDLRSVALYVHEAIDAEAASLRAEILGRDS